MLQKSPGQSRNMNNSMKKHIKQLYTTKFIQQNIDDAMQTYHRSMVTQLSNIKDRTF